MHPETLAHTRDRYHHRARRYRGQADGVADGGEETISAADRRLVQELLTVERRELIRLRGGGAISEARMRRGGAGPPPRRGAGAGPVYTARPPRHAERPPPLRPRRARP